MAIELIKFLQELEKITDEMGKNTVKQILRNEYQIVSFIFQNKDYFR